MGNTCLSPPPPKEEENIFRDEGGIDIESIMNEISQHLNHVRQGEPTTVQNQQWPDRLSELFIFLSTGKNNNNNGSGFNNFTDALDIVQEVLDNIGSSSLILSGFFVISYGLKRVQDVNDNKEECFSVLEEMNFLNKIVNQCTERERLKEGMQAEIRAATQLIMNGTLMCLTQLKCSPFSKFCNTYGNTRQLTDIKRKINEKYNDISFQMDFEIVDAVSALSKTPRLSRKYPNHAGGIGFETSVKEVADLLEWGTENNAVAVILDGFGGMGKTTLADAVFNRVNINSVDGEECKYSHVELFKSIESSPDIVKLQKKILEDLLGRKNIPEIRKYQDGQKQIHDTLEKVPAFIYIDNVVEKDELRQLLPLNFEGARKVRLLITSRDRNVRKACRMETPPKEYRIRGISSGDARDLLTKQMAAAAPVEDEISSSVHRIIDRCHGIPLMLNLVVQELSSAKDKTEVHEVIQELEKLEGEEFGAKLDSYFFLYDKLPQVCKEPFLDICSFFIGWDWDTVADIVGKTALDSLAHRSLVAKGKDGAVTVPEVIMKVGRRKAEDQMRMRFPETSQLMTFLLDDEKVEQLRYLIFKPAKDWNQLITKKLKMPQNLKYMEIDGKFYCDNLEIFPKGLLRLQELRILKLFNFKGLKELPSVLGHLVKGFRELTLSNCKSIKELPYSISMLRSLRVLKMDHCKDLKYLPDDFASLNSLEILCINHCDSLEELPHSFEDLPSLTVLNLSSCTALKRLPDGLGKITSLVKLDVSHCKDLNSLPESIQGCKSLLLMDISWCSSLEQLPNEFCPPSITYLKLTRCTALKNLPDQFGQSNVLSLRVLKLKSCTKLQNLPVGFSKLKYLVHLDLSGCIELVELCENFGDLLSLTTLSLDSCKELKKLPPNFHFPCSLQHLNLSNCEMLEGESMNSLVETKALQMVYIKNSGGLKEKWREMQEESKQWSFTVDIGQVELDELREETILLEIRPADASYDIRLQSLKNMYDTEKERYNIEIISVPVGQQSIKMEQFSGDIPWLLLQNSWTISRTEKYFLIKSCKWEEKDGELSELWYSSRFVKIQVNEEVTSVPVLSMLERWGPRAYPFSDKKIKDLKDEEWNERKRMSTSSLEFLFKPLMGELHELREVIRQRKIICLLCEGKHPRTNRVRTKEFARCINDAMKDVMDDIHFIYVPHYPENKKEMLTVTDSIKIPYFPMVQGSKKPKLQHLLTLEHWDAMRFWMRVGDLRKEIEGMGENDKKLQGLKILLDSVHWTCLSMAVMDREGEVLTTKGRQIVDIFDSQIGGTNDQRLQARKLVGQMINGSKEESEAAALQLESCLF